jgi:hypothetical protein
MIGFISTGFAGQGAHHFPKLRRSAPKLRTKLREVAKSRNSDFPREFTEDAEVALEFTDPAPASLEMPSSPVCRGRSPDGCGRSPDGWYLHISFPGSPLACSMDERLTGEFA